MTAFPLTSISSVRPRRTLMVMSGLVLALMLAFLAPGQVNPSSADDTRGINGTVMSIGQTSMRVAIKSGLKTVFVDADTQIKNGREIVALSSITPGDRVSASVEPLSGDQLLAKKIHVRGKSSSKRVQHLTGVVIERGENTIRLASRNGRSVEIEIEDDEQPAIADVVTTIVDNDLATGKLKARQIDRVDGIVERLEKSLEEQVDRAKAAVLRKIIDESARQHLDTLNQTLDQVEEETREKIEAALTKFRSDYAQVAERVGNAPPEESYQGVISGISYSSITVSSNTGDGSRTFDIDASTGISVTGNSEASLADVELGQLVTISFVPVSEGESGDPLALLIQAEPPALPPVVADAIDDLSDNVVEGEVIVVEEDDEGGNVVLIVDEDGSGDTVGVEVTPDTEVIVDGEAADAGDLEPDQQVELTVDEDGVTADSVVASTDEPQGNEQPISGIVTAVDADRNTIVVAPATGEPIRLTVGPDTVITVEGAEPSLFSVNVQDAVIGASRYDANTSVLIRLSVAPIRADESAAGETGNGESEQGSGGREGGSVTPAPFSIVGVLRSFDGDSFVFDGMTLPKNSGIDLPEGVEEGNSVELLFSTTEDGTIVLTGIRAH